MAGYDRPGSSCGSSRASAPRGLRDQPLPRISTRRVAPTPSDVETRVNSLLDRGRPQLDERLGELDARAAAGAPARPRAHPRLVRRRLRPDGARGRRRLRAGLDDLWRTLPLAEPVAGRGHASAASSASRRSSRSSGAATARSSRREPRARRRLPARATAGSSRSPTRRRSCPAGTTRAAGRRRATAPHRRARRAPPGGRRRRARPARARGSASRVVVVGAEEMRARVRATALARDARRVVGWATAEAHATRASCSRSRGRVLERGGRAARRQLLERWREEAGAERARGRRLGGDARGRLRRPRRGAARPGRRRPRGVRSARRAGARRSTAAAARSTERRCERADDGLDLAVHQTLAHGGTVDVVRRPTRPRAGRGRRGAAALLGRGGRARAGARRSAVTRPRARRRRAAQLGFVGDAVLLELCAPGRTRVSSEPTVSLYAWTAPSRPLAERREVVGHRARGARRARARARDRLAPLSATVSSRQPNRPIGSSAISVVGLARITPLVAAVLEQRRVVLERRADRSPRPAGT